MARVSFIRFGLIAVVVVALAASALLASGMLRAAGGPGSEFARGGGGGQVADGNPEAEEQGAEVQQRTAAFEAAIKAGQAGKPQAISGAPAAGWAGEQLVDATADDWEPAIAADPHSNYVYALTTRYGSSKPCPGNCPTPYIALLISPDNGATWPTVKPLCACKGSGQFDPIIEVVPNTGAVYALYLNGFNVMFTKSADKGQHWTAPVKTYGNVSWTDKPVIAISDSGTDVYAGFNGPTGGDPYVAISHDGGATWTQKKLADTNKYFFNFDADVAPDGTVYLAESALLYGGGGNKGTFPTAPIDEHVFVSTDHGATWLDRQVASVQPGWQCVAAGCTPDYYLGHEALTVDGTGRVVFLYDGSTSVGAPQTITSRTSTDRGVTWSAPFTLSTVGQQATDPTVESTGNGDVRAWYMQTSNANADRWNVYYRTSSDGGITWPSAAVKLSDATSGAAYKSSTGFLEPYGDYGEMAITSLGRTIAIWGEGNSYTGPGGVWINRQP